MNRLLSVKYFLNVILMTVLALSCDSGSTEGPSLILEEENIFYASGPGGGQGVFTMDSIYQFECNQCKRTPEFEIIQYTITDTAGQELDYLEKNAGAAWRYEGDEQKGTLYAGQQLVEGERDWRGLPERFNINLKIKHVESGTVYSLSGKTVFNKAKLDAQSK